MENLWWNSPKISHKISQKIFFLLLATIRSFANIDRPVTFLLYNLQCYFFIWNRYTNYFRFKTSFRKYYSVCPVCFGICFIKGVPGKCLWLNLQVTVSKNIIATTKIQNNYGAIQSLIFPIFSLLLLVKLSLLILFASFLVSVFCFFFDSFLSKIISLPTIAVAIIWRVITIWEAIQKRSHEPIYKKITRRDWEQQLNYLKNYQF